MKWNRAPALVLGFGLAACSSSGPPTTIVPPARIGYPATYVQKFAIAVPGVPPAGGRFSFDIGVVDNAASRYYLADRNTNGVDVFNTTIPAYISTAGQGLFQGPGTSGPGGSPSTNGGPNGIVPIGNGVVFAGDGNSTLKVVNTNNGTLLATIPTVNPYTGPAIPGICGGTGTPTTGAGNQRVDEMDYDPSDGIVLAINGAACPPFGTFFSSTPPYAILGTVDFPTANNGGEQPRWDPTQHKFLVAIPSTLTNPGGEIDVVDPKSFAITNVLPLTDCVPNGLALGKNEAAFLGCSSPTGTLQTVNASTGALISSIPGQTGADETYYNPVSNRFFAADINPPGPGALVVADGTGNFITSLPTAGVAHSVAVDQYDQIWVPQAVNVIVYGH